MSQENVRLVRKAFQAFLAGIRRRRRSSGYRCRVRGTVVGFRRANSTRSAEIDETFEAEIGGVEERRLEAEIIDAGDESWLLHVPPRSRRGSSWRQDAVVISVSGGR